MTLSITAAHTVTIDNGGEVISLGGSAYYALTFGASGGFDEGFGVTVVNADPDRAKSIVLPGNDASYLWPGQSIVVFNIGSAWRVIGRTRWRLPRHPTFYVDPRRGSDAGDGLAPGPDAFATVQYAWDTITREIDHNKYVPVIQLPADGRTKITEQVSLAGTNPGNHIMAALLGSESNPDNTVWELDNSKVAIFATDFAILTIRGINFRSTGGNSTMIQASQFAVLDLQDIRYGRNKGGVAMMVIGDGLAKINVNTTNYISGDMSNACVADGNGVINLAGGLEIDKPNIVISDTLCRVANGGAIFDGGTERPFSGAGLATIKGVQAIASSNGVININASAFPANMTKWYGTTGGRMRGVGPNCAFQASLSENKLNATGDGTIYTIPWDSMIYNSQDAFDPATGFFGARVDGIHNFSTIVRLSGLTSSHTNGYIYFQFTDGIKIIWQGNPYAMSVSGILNVSGPIDRLMKAGQSVSVSVHVSSGPKSVGVDMGDSVFSGRLLD